MRAALIAVLASAGLGGCIPFVHDAVADPATPAGYSGEVLSQHPAQAVADCIAAVTGIRSVSANGTLTIASSPTSYVVETVDGHGYQQTRVLVRDGQSDPGQVALAIKCAAGIPMADIR